MVSDSSSLNRSDLAELVANHTALSSNENRRLGLIQKKVELYSRRYRDPHYLPQSGILLCSHWPSAERYAHCSRPNYQNRSGSCKLHQFCPYCCYLKGQQLVGEFLPHFSATQWHFLTLSFHGDILFESHNHAVSQYWEAGQNALKQLLKDQLIRGYYATQELKINGFEPTRVLPHLHAIVDADQINDNMLHDIEQGIARHEGVELTASLETQTISTEASFNGRLQYLYKPLNLVEPYRSGWLQVEQDRRQRAPAFNSAVSDFLGRHQQLTYRQRKMVYAGSMHSQHRGYVGVLAGERDAYREYIRSIQREGPVYPQDRTTLAL